MATPNYPSIPDPTATLEGLRDSVLAIKQVLEILTGQRGGGGAAVITNDTLPPPPEIPPAFPPTGGTLTGDVLIDKSEPRLTLDKNASGEYNGVVGSLNGKQRWFLALGDNEAETGSGNTGSDFGLHRYNDAGTWIGEPLHIDRATGAASFANALSVAGSFTVSSGGATLHGWAGDNNQGVLFLNLAQNRYLHWTGTKYYLNGAPLHVNGALQIDGVFTNTAGYLHLYGYAGNNNMSVIYLNAAQDRYLHYDGGNYILANSHLYTAAGRVWGTGDGTPLWLGGGSMTGRITFPARSSGNPGIEFFGSDIIGVTNFTNTITIRGGGHAAMSFLVEGTFGGNFGLASDGNFYCGGWSYGAGTYYQFWNTRNLASSTIKQAIRHVYAGDVTHGRGAGLSEPYAYACCTGFGFDGALNNILRYRYIQMQGVDGGWYTQSGTA